MSIVLYTGRPGTGKTYCMTHHLIKKLNSGWIVYSNYLIKWNGFRGIKREGFKFKKVNYPASNLRPWTKMSEWEDMTNCIIAVDEGHRFLNSRKWETLSEQTQLKLSQHRKDAVHLFLTSQHINRLDIIARELVDFWFNCEMWWRPENVFKRSRNWFIILREYDPDTDIKQYKLLPPLSKKIIFFTKKRAMRYDTLQKITPK